MFKLGLVGCGIISANHIEAISVIDDAVITAVCDINEENLKRACEEAAAIGYRDYKEMLEKEELDLVVINLPHGLHCEVACYCAMKGVNILLEKPMAISTAECDEIIKACKDNNVMLWVGHPNRYTPTIMFAKQLVDSGELGELVSYNEIRNVNYFADTRPRWFLNKKMSGGGIMINLGAHSLDKIKYYTGSSIESITGKIHIREGYDCEDSAQVFVRMKNGVTGTVNLTGHTAAIDLKESLYLTKGEIRVNCDGTVDYCGADGVFKKKECEGPSCITNQMIDVIKTMREGKYEPVVSGEYGREIIHAIKKLYGDEK